LSQPKKYIHPDPDPKLCKIVVFLPWTPSYRAGKVRHYIRENWHILEKALKHPFLTILCNLFCFPPCMTSTSAELCMFIENFSKTLPLSTEKSSLFKIGVFFS